MLNARLYAESRLREMESPGLSLRAQMLREAQLRRVREREERKRGRTRLPAEAGERQQVQPHVAWT
jgi:hypothetical protein